MSNYINRVVRHFRAPSLEELEQKLEMHNQLTQKMTEVIQIQKVGSFWYAHYYTSLPVNLNEKVENKEPQENKKRRGRPRRAK